MNWSSFCSRKAYCVSYVFFVAEKFFVLSVLSVFVAKKFIVCLLSGAVFVAEKFIVCPNIIVILCSTTKCLCAANLCVCAFSKVSEEGTQLVCLVITDEKHKRLFHYKKNLSIFIPNLWKRVNLLFYR